MKELSLDQKLIHKDTLEYFNAIRTSIQFSGSQYKVIAISSVKDNEGKSVTAFNIAYSFASIGKSVLLVDADTRNSVFIQRMKIQDKMQGLTNYLAGENQLNEVIMKTSVPNLHMIFSGPVPPNPTSLLQSDAFNLMIDACRHHYDYVIVDTPPIGLITDASIIAHQCDATIMVVESGKHRRRVVQKLTEKLKQSGAEFLGVILNKVDTSVMKYGSYGNYGNYGEYGKKSKK